ncbi:hypothetical protein KC19_5G159200 [Ceratodon purpureus]|uniref:Uncharacterized protein n=1 Tax=Ceratodon purpureus TaxID=3225 RepID=A0A8T0I3F5_CERPU|nr:hypothetical protein KC19_5G159200 [Ceratodon purpureus]
MTGLQVDVKGASWEPAYTHLVTGLTYEFWRGLRCDLQCPFKDLDRVEITGRQPLDTCDYCPLLESPTSEV